MRGELEEARQRRLTDALTWGGYLWAHMRPARTLKGWRTPVAGPGGEGFPDLVAARDGQVLFIEVKRDGGKLTPGQRRWKAVLGDAMLVCDSDESEAEALSVILGPLLKR